MVWEKEILDAESKGLKKEALDLADDMHDAIDDFILSMEPSRRNKYLIQSKIEASYPFQGFRTRVDEVSGRCHSKWKWKNKCAEPIFSLCSSKNSKSSHPSKPPPPRAPFVRKDASELFGMGRWRDDLISYLVGEELQLKTASIVGMAGVGKTTLAHLAYEEIGNKFQSRAFVSVTPSPNMKEVLTSILQQVGAQPLAGTKARTEEDIIQILSNFLEDKRYLVIIDDIWHHGEWDIIRKSFPENNLGSRIVITTRINSVAGDDFDNNKLYIRMNPKWMRRWVYGPDKKDDAVRLKPDMVGEGFDWDHPIVRMCGAVPLALICIFSAMAMVQEQQKQLGIHVKARDVQDMIEKQVKKNGIHNTPGFEPLVESLQLGYNDLPHHTLKTCLLYCSIYPENYEFYLNDLVMRWVGEGFIYKEDAAKGYFEELVNRGLMLRWREDDGAYLMNPMMQNFLRWKSREDNFITCSTDITSADACRIHRLCVDGNPVDGGAVEGLDPFSGLDWSRIRSLVVFECGERYIPFEKLERVRVLDLQYHQLLELKKARWDYFSDFEFVALGNHHVKDICGLLRVRHLLGLDGLGISEIPPEIARLQYLETLQVRGTRIRELPSEIGDLQQLKTLDVSGNALVVLRWEIIGRLKKLKTLDVSRNKQITEVPREIRDLQHLETLSLSANPGITNLPQEIEKLQHLKTLVVGSKIKELPREIENLLNLETLDLRCNTMLTELPREIGKLQNLETLDLRYNKCLTKLPREIGKLQNLKRLLVSRTKVVKIPKEIGGLKQMKILELNPSIGVLPWEAGQLSKLEGVPECIRQAWNNSDLVSELAGEILSIKMIGPLSHSGGLIVGSKHMHIPQWIKDHFNKLASLDIRIYKLEEKDLMILREMPNLYDLKLRLEVIPRKPIAISDEGFPILYKLTVDSRVPRVVTFQEGAMPMLECLSFEFRFYGGQPNENPLGIKHLRSLRSIEFRCNQEWYRADSLCISAMIDIIRKEAREHRNNIHFLASGRSSESFPANESAQEVSSSGTGEIEEEILKAA